MSDEMKTPLLRQVIGSGFYKQDEQKRAIPVVPEVETEELLRKKHSYPENIIISSRYTVFNYLPKSLLEQFRRLANVYFLVIGIIATIGLETNYYATAIDPIGILAPMLIVVFISVIKDGVEDYKRHRADNVINSKPTRRVSPDGSVENILWRDILVGDLLLIYGDEELPADCVVITSGGLQKQSCFVETAAIDGETNLKMKLPATEVKNLELSENKKSVVGPLDSVRSCIVAEAPNSSIHRFNGFLEVPADRSLTADGQRTPKQVPLNEKNLLLRGSTLRATEWCLCIAVYTGADTKLSLNSKRPPSKLSSVDRIVNRTLLVAICTMIAVCIISMLFEIVWMDQNTNASYLCLQQDDLSSEYPSGGCESSSPSSVLTIFTFATLYNNFVCISMYVSLEMVYLAQSFYVSNDLAVYDEERDCPAECHTSGMCADLGQVQYILSDKTGTLTKNQMIVQQFSVANKIFGKPISMNDREESSHDQQKASHISAHDIDFISNSESSLLLHETMFYPHLELIQRLSIVNRSSTLSPEQRNLVNLQNEAFERLLILQFMRVLVYCNTAMLMPDENGKTEIHNLEELKDRLQAESPDEVALILSAAEHASVLLEKRTTTEIVASGLTSFYGEEIASSITTDSERVELLGVNEFDSDRKMMSVVIRLPENIQNGSKLIKKRNMLLCKGADSSVLANCVAQENPFMEHCKSHIDYFANTGLRTLVLGYRELTDEEVNKWIASYKEACNSISERSELLKACANTIEKDLILIGAIGIEDELQDGVPEAIKTMHDGGMNVWMITGDKAETAVAIGKKCALIQPGKHEIERVLNLSDEALRQRIIDLHAYITSDEFRAQSGERFGWWTGRFSCF
jgi:phospholipid-translocating P-type ATPase (flippase)